MMPWELIETGFFLGVRVAFFVAGFAMAISMVTLGLWGLVIIVEKMKP